ncbi:MAG: hypothetical protein KBB75_01525 [Candidatus Pacebacteria bacterium]|jgi:uncharacterized protein (DUF885 family)|nr:hypothetical protein [Candidatus Paceibacterota bacterium]
MDFNQFERKNNLSTFEDKLKKSINEIKTERLKFITEAGKEILLRDINEKYSEASQEEQDEVLKDLSIMNSEEIFNKYTIDRRSFENKALDEMSTTVQKAKEIISHKYRTKNNSITEAGIDIILSNIADDLAMDSEGTLEKLENMSKEDLDKKFF